MWFYPGPGQLRRTAPRCSGEIHNPTSRNRQGFDFVIPSHICCTPPTTLSSRSRIASCDAEQPSLRRQIVTQIIPASAFYPAEEYHQRYLEKHGQAACAATIR